MADPRYSAAVWRPGVNADNGHTTMESTVCHYTVGRDSRPIGDRGYFHFLVSRDGTVTQFARADAVCWHAGDPWNGRGPGIEVEYLDEPEIFTPEAAEACGLLDQWLHDEWNIPLDFYDGPRITAHNGFITHRSLIQTGDYHNDYWPYLPTGDDMGLNLTDFAWINDHVTGVGVDGQTNITNRMVLDAVLALSGAAAPVGGLSEDDIRAIVREELDRTKLGH